MSESEELLFFDTFAHGTSEELNLDLVQFPKPVYINQVRVIPLGAKVQADFPGGVRLGATNPSQFKLDLFVNDLSKPGASAFETLGTLDYNQNSTIHYECDKKVPTDGLVLRGWYTTVTLAVYGAITRLPIITTPQTPPPAPAKPASPILVQPLTSEVQAVPPFHVEDNKFHIPALIDTVVNDEPNIDAVSRKLDEISVPSTTTFVVDIKKEAIVGDDLDKESNNKVRIVLDEHVKSEKRSRRSDEPNRSRDSSEYHERDWDKNDSDYRNSRSDHRSSRHDLDRNRSDSDRQHRDRPFESSDRTSSKADSDRKRSDANDRTLDRNDLDRTKGDGDRGVRTKSDVSERSSRSERNNHHDSERTRGSDSDRLRTDERGRRDRERDRDRDRRKERRTKSRERSDRDRSRDRHRDQPKERNSKEQLRNSRENSRRPRSPPLIESSRSGKKTPEATTPSKFVPELSPPPPPPVVTKKEELECFSPGVEMEAISDDDMPEVDNLLIARNAGEEIADEEVELEPEGNNIDDRTNLSPAIMPVISAEINKSIKVEPMEEDDQETLPAHPLVDSDDIEPPGTAVSPIPLVPTTPTPTTTPTPAEVVPDAVPSAELEELEELEEILSDEDLMFEDYGPAGTDMSDMDGCNDLDIDIGKTFNPYNFELHPLQRLATGQKKNVEDHRLTSTLELTSRGEKWIDSMGQLASMLPDCLIHWQQTEAADKSEQLAPIYDQIINWLLDGLDFELACEQVGHCTNTVRHIKAGLKLSTALAQCPSTLLELGVERGVLSKIASLYVAPHMALSLKLMCLRSLDELLSSPYAMEKWLKRPVHEETNGYIFLVRLIESSKQPSRAQVSLAALVRKIQIYQTFDRIHDIGQTLSRLPATNPFVMPRRSKNDLRRFSGVSIESQDSQNSQDGFSNARLTLVQRPFHPHVNQLINSLKQVRQIYTNPLLTIGQLVRFLPVRRQFDISASASSSNSLQGVYNFMRHHRFLSVLLLLAAHPLTCTDAVVMDLVLLFLNDFGRTQHGLCFLLSEPEVTILILRALMHQHQSLTGQGSSGALVDSSHDTEYANVEELNASHVATSTTSHRLGVQLTQSLHVIQCLDSLLTDTGEQNRVDCLQSMHSLVFTNSGRLVLIHVLALDNNLDVLVNLLTPDSNADVEAKLKDSASRGYAAELVALVVRCTENAQFLAKYGQVLLSLVQQQQSGESHAATKLIQLTRWVEILGQSQIFALDTGLPILCDLVKLHADDAVNFPPELIVALRLLCPFAITECNNQLKEEQEHLVTTKNLNDEEQHVELKYSYAVVQLFSRDLHGLLVSVLLKLCQSYDQPTVHSAVLAGPQGSLLLSIVRPALKLIRRLLTQVIRCRDSDFGDLTAVPVLLQTYALVGAVPASSLHHKWVAECRADIIATLLAFSQPSIPVTTDSDGVKASSAPEDALARSLWTQMVQEVLKFIHSSSGPANFITGLHVLNEMLPLPLPLPRITSADCSEEIDTLEMVNARKLWSVHLHTLAPQIQQVIRLLCCSGPPLMQLLRKVCVQIADLSATTALVVARAAVDAVLSSCLVAETSPSPAPKEGPENADKDIATVVAASSSSCLPTTLICSSHSARVFNFLASIITHAPIKAAVLQLCRCVQKSDDKYADLLPCLCLVLKCVSTTSAHVQSQECVVSIFQALVDPDICLLPNDRVDYDVYLSAALPSKELVQQMVSGLWDHLANTEHNYSSLLPALRTLTLLTENNYTFGHLRRVLERKRHALWDFFAKMASGFSKDSSDCLSTLSTALELLRTLVKAPAVDGCDGKSRHQTPRSVTLSVAILSAALQWRSDVKRTSSSSPPPPPSEDDVDSPKDKHPLLVLRDLVREHSTEEESMESLKESLTALIDILEEEKQEIESDSASGRMQDAVSSEMAVLPLPEPLNLQFAQRQLLTELPAASSVAGCTEDEDRLSISFWMAPMDEVDSQEADQQAVQCDLLDVAQNCLTDLDLARETEKLCKKHTEPARLVGWAGSTTAILTDVTAIELQQNPQRPPGRAILSTARDIKTNKPYVAPMRGRGFGRGGVNSRNDPFRSRAPNTSRPPSLHVDDFVAMEKNGGGSASVSGSTSGSGGAYGTKATRGGTAGRGNGGNSRTGRGGGFVGSNDRGRFSSTGFNFPQQPRREATRTRVVGNNGGPASSSSGKWEDLSYNNSPVPALALATSRGFQSTNRVWSNNNNTGNNSSTGKERYTSPSNSSGASSSSSAGRTRHSRTFSR